MDCIYRGCSARFCRKLHGKVSPEAGLKICGLLLGSRADRMLVQVVRAESYDFCLS